MALLARLTSLARNLFRERRAERDLDEELRSYLELLTQEKVRTGMPTEEARRQAQIELGGAAASGRGRESTAGRAGSGLLPGRRGSKGGKPVADTRA
jgi:hypothetical protein